MATNLEVMQMLSREVGDSIARALNPGNSVRIVVRPNETAWIVRGALLEAVRETGRVPDQSLSSQFDAELGLVSADVEYSNVRRSGLFGAKVLDRLVRVDFTAIVTDRTSGAVLLNTRISRSSSDVVELSDLTKLESPGIPATRGVLPKEGFFSSLLEPVIAVGAIAVAVFLLFHVRS